MEFKKLLRYHRIVIIFLRKISKYVPDVIDIKLLSNPANELCITFVDMECLKRWASSFVCSDFSRRRSYYSWRLGDRPLLFSRHQNACFCWRISQGEGFSKTKGKEQSIPYFPSYFHILCLGWASYNPSERRGSYCYPVLGDDLQGCFSQVFRKFWWQC